MAGSKKLTYEIGIDAGDAIGSLKSFSGAVKSAMKSVESELDEGATSGEKLARALDEIGSRTKEEFASAATAAEAMGDALKRAGSSLDVADVLPQLQKLGLSFDEITADADKLAVSLKGLDDVKATGLKDLDATAPGLATKLDAVGKSADSSKSVLANMIGNTTQDLGALAGVAGSAGVAIGQIGEYAADAAASGEGLKSVFKNMGAIAGPAGALALIGIGLQTIQANMAKVAETKAFNKDRVQGFVDALADAVLSAEELRDVLAADDEAGIFVRIENESTNVQKSVEKTFGTFKKFKEAVDEGAAGFDKYAAGLLSAAEAAGLNGIQLEHLRQGLADARDGTLNNRQAFADLGGQWVDGIQTATALGAAISGIDTANRDAGESTAFYGEETKKTSQHVEDLNAAYRDAATDTYAESQDRAADAIARVNDKLREQADALNEQIDGAAAAADSTIAYGDAQDDFIRAVQASIEGEAALLEARKKHGESSKEAQEATDTLNDAYTAERDALIDAARAAQRLAQDQATASGTQQTATGKVDAFNASLLANARYASPAARQAVYDYLFQVNQIPPEKATEIQALIDQGRLDEAEAALNAASATRQAAIQADANTAAAERDLDNTANPNGQPRTAGIKAVLLNPNYGKDLAPIVIGPHAAPPAPAAPGELAVTPFGAPAVAAQTSTPVVTVPVVFKVPTAAEIVRRVGTIRIPLLVQAGLRADRRISGVRE